MQSGKTRTTSTPAESAEAASQMLEAALQQMDGIINNGGVNTVGQNVGTVPISMSGSIKLNERNLISASNVLATAKTLAVALQQVDIAAPAPDANTAAIISDWLETHIPRQDTDERLRRLQREKESLALQYQMLVERVSAQADKIIELEGQLTEKTQQLSNKEEQLQRQILSRSTLETQKLELMSALSELKLHRAALERENAEFNGEIGDVQNFNNSFSGRMPGSMGNLNQFNFAAIQQKTPPSTARHQIQPQFHSLPRSHAPKNNNNNNNNNNKSKNNNRIFDSNANTKQRNVAFASNEKILIEDNLSGNTNHENMYGSFISQTNSTPSPNLRERSAKSLRSIFGKMRRSNSGNLELPGLEQAEQEFKRGGSRATTSGRIEWTTQSSQISTLSKDYMNWSPQEVCNWLCDLGLGCYEIDCRKWLKSNTNISFFKASPVDIERELNLKTPLHRKKILLAIDELTGKETDNLALKAAQLDIGWVLRWLDDIGLPQYKDTFLQAKLDGRMLHRLTMEDLTHLHVTSCLHIASLKRAIQCMRQMEWNPECLIRRSTNPKTFDNIDDTAGEKIDTDDNETESIFLWTAHRVMEWLRVVDLSEYAPNLRGAGVHGALMLYEPRFNADLLADLLSIPPSKTLLRRHLATHFKELLGRDVIQKKRDTETAPGYQALTITSKMKPPKKTQFSLKRRKSTKGSVNDVDWTDFVCPMIIPPNENISELQKQLKSPNNSASSSPSINNSNSLISN